MRHHPWFLFGLCLWLTACGEAEEQLDPGPVKWSSQPTMPLDLQQLIDDAEDGATVTIPEGTFTIEATVLSAVPCLNCEDDKPLTTTRGLLVSGKAVHLIGRGADRTRLRITASYGLVFLDSRGSSVQGLSITGIERDPDPEVTSAAILAFRSDLAVTGVRLHDLTNQVAGVTNGVSGIVGGLNSHLYLAANRIERTGWDGITLFKGTFGEILGNEVFGGRGVAIGVTRGASANVVGNVVAGFWKGLATFDGSNTRIFNNIVHDMIGWGIAVRDSRAEVRNNLVVHAGVCGVITYADTVIGLHDNMIVDTGFNPSDQYCERVGLNNYAPLAAEAVRDNLFFKYVEGAMLAPPKGFEDHNLFTDPGLEAWPEHRFTYDLELVTRGIGPSAGPYAPYLLEALDAPDPLGPIEWEERDGLWPPCLLGSGKTSAGFLAALAAVLAVLAVLRRRDRRL